MKTILMKTLMLLVAVPLAFCSDGNKVESTAEPISETKVIKLDTNLDKYIGCYKHNRGTSDSWSIGKIPTNAIVRFSDQKYFPLDQKYIGKCFLVQYCFGLDINQSTNEHGYCLPAHMGMGSILLGVDEAGNMHIKNYSISENGVDISTESTYGMLVQNSDGSYCINQNNTTYVLK